MTFCLHSLFFFSFGKKVWTQVAPMGDKRINFGFASLKGCLFAVGGWSGENVLKSCEKYYPDRDEWVEIEELPYPL